jgi:hypothetical protein
MICAVGKQSQLVDWEHKEVFGEFLNDDIMSGKIGCSYRK